jgi:thymidylate synthase ThyX
MNEVTILIADDDPGMRLVMRKLAEQAEGYALVGEAEDGIALIRLYDELRPEVVLMDVEMPGMTGIECARAIQQELTRHRHFSFNVESTRWVSYLKKPLRFVTKPPEGWDVPEEAVELLEEFCELSALVYETLLEMGAPRDYARKAFTLALASKIRMAGNFRAWREMLGKRLGKTAHPEAREIAERALSELRDRVLGVFDGIGEA